MLLNLVLFGDQQRLGNNNVFPPEDAADRGDYRRRAATLKGLRYLHFDPTGSGRHIQRLVLIHGKYRPQPHRFRLPRQLRQFREILFARVSRPAILQPAGITRHRKLRRDVVPDLQHFFNTRLLQQLL